MSYKRVFLVLFLCLAQQIHSMEDDNLFSYIYSQFKKQLNKHSSEFSDAFHQAVKIAQDKNFSPEKCEIIKEYIKNGADPNWPIGEDKQTLLNFAIINQKKNFFKFLLDNNADINKGDKDNMAPLHTLARIYAKYKNLNIPIEELLKNNADIHAKNINGLTPLHAAVWFCSTDCVKLLVKYNADINEKSNTMTPLALAIFDNKTETPPEIIKTLCTLRASLSFVDIKSKNNIFHVLATNNTSIKYFKPIITHARFDDFDKGSKTILCTLLTFQRLEIKLPKDIKLRILAQLPLSDLYPHKKLCKELLQNNYHHILLPQIHERVKNIKQILETPGEKNQTALQYAEEKFANNQDHLNTLRPFLDGTLLQKNYDDFIENFPAILNSELEENKNNLARQMFDNCAELFLDVSPK